MADGIDAILDEALGGAATPKWDLKQANDGSWVWVNRETKQIVPAPEMGITEPTAPRPSTITRDKGVYEYYPGSPDTPGAVRQIATFPADTEDSTFTDKYGNRYYQGPSQTWPGSFEPAQPPPAVMTWQDPNAGLMREQDELDTQYKRAQIANLGAKYPNVITYGNAAYKVDPYTGAVEKVHDFPQPEPTPVDLWKLQNDRETQRIADDQAMARQRMQTQASLTNTLGDQWLRASQWAMPPEWGGVPPGFGADGPYGQLLRMGGSNPQSVQLPQMNFDPLNAWRMAQDALGG